MTMPFEEVAQLITDALEGATCEVTDLGGGNHLGLDIAWPGFEGQILLKQHKMVLEILRPHMDGGTGEIHAVQIKTITS